ncbi:putative vitellogenin receptor [Anopheles cruzii]|uniref:putative vitellogenin receptor n=1 Tax=Anopheles cruzii TaxID=68878 RepID=UPI0022EC9088|nr:putative vitellogenin receptor [Anopheles cruzii]
MCRLAFLVLLVTTFTAENGTFARGSSSACGTQEFQCANGACIPQAGRCNDSRDCSDGSDESECDYFLCRGPFWYKCKQDATCISASSRCDRHRDCAHGDDEENCEHYEVPHTPMLCGSSEFTCTDKMCIPADLVCDGIEHCLDSSDETIGCIDIENKCTGFLCRNKHCLHTSSWVCDGMNDCGDGSDEEHCLKECTLEHHKFECGNNHTCIALEKVCDGTDDCGDNSDEASGCSSSSCVHLKCAENNCKVMPNGDAVCVCKAGYTFNNATGQCEDINECDRYGLCTQGCINTPGSFRCTCIQQFNLRRDNRSCELTDGSEALMLYTSQRSVGALYLTSLHQYYVAKDLSQVIGVSYDGQHVYWTDIAHKTESIERSQEDGSKRELLLTAGLISPEDIALDWLTGNIYFSDSGQMHIAVCSNDGFFCKALIQEKLHKPRGIALLPQNGSLYYSDWGDKACIAKARMDGSEQTILITDGIHWPNGLTLDWPNERLYWIDAKMKRIESVRFDGRERVVVISDVLKHPFSVTLFNDRIYWSDWDTNSVQSCDKFTGKNRRTMVHDRMIFDVHIYHSSMQPKTSHPCLNHTCSHLCLLTSNTSYTCACPYGMVIQRDAQTCQYTTKRQTLLLGVGNYLVSLKHHSFGRHEAAKGEPLQLTISCLAFNSLTGEVLIADNVQKAIFAVNMERWSSRKVVSSGIGRISAMAFDGLSNALYWSDAERSTIEIYSLQNHYRSIIQHFLGHDAPIALALIPEIGKMFVALRSNVAPWHTHVDRLEMTGRELHTHVIEDGLGSNGTISFCVDHDLRAVFMSDMGSGRIDVISYDGDTRHLFRDYLRLPVSLTIVGDELFWTGYQSQRMYWSDKHNIGATKKITIPLPFGMHAPDEIPITVTSPAQRPDHPCQQRNAGCSHICVATGLFTSACVCPTGMVFNSSHNRQCVDAAECEFKCDSGECLSASKRCNGQRDCPDGSDEQNCGQSKTRIAIACHRGEFQCTDGGKCIPMKQRCDNTNNCEDASDEQHCEGYLGHHDCRDSQFTCRNGLCIDITGRCDGYADCIDGSDEFECTRTSSKNDSATSCDADLFRCNNGQCISKYWECDGTPECADGSDEHEKCNLNDTCHDGYTKCAVGFCIANEMLCDGNDDCGDGSDEENCSPDHITLCDELERKNSTVFYCNNPKYCFDISVRCNGSAECPQGEDEADCSKCGPHDFECNNGQCIRDEWRCDKEIDCNDGSDEVNCTESLRSSLSQPISCGTNTFECKPGECIAISKLCDGVDDCSNGQDEKGSCDAACLGGLGPCDQVCRKTPSGSVCSCHEGFELTGDRKKCVDINECVIGKPCAQVCTNIQGSYRCFCYDGYMLKSDKTTCKATGASYYLLYARFDQIRKLTVNPPTIQTILNANSSRITSMDISVRSKKLFFTTENIPAIFQLDLETHKIHMLSDIGKPEKVAVDWITNNVYLIDKSEPSIKVCNLERGVCARLVSFMRQHFLKALCVDPVNKYMFYSVLFSWIFEEPHSIIYRANLDGTLRQIVAKDNGLVSTLAVDPNSKTLYFTDLSKNTLNRVSYDGKELAVLVRNQPHMINNPVAMYLYENHAIIVNRAWAALSDCQLFGEYKCQRFNVNVPTTQHILFVQEAQQPVVENFCDQKRSECTHLCIPSQHEGICVCHNGQAILAGDRCPDSLKDGMASETIYHHDHGNTLPVSETPNNQQSNSFHFKLLKTMLIIAFSVALCGLVYYIRRRRAGNEFDVRIHFNNTELTQIDKDKTEEFNMRPV